MKGLAVHFGVDEYCRGADVDSVCPGLVSAAFDARGFAQLSVDRSFQLFRGAALVNSQVKIKNLMAAIDGARTTLVAGDFFTLTFDGYGFPKAGKSCWRMYRDTISIDVLLRALQSIATGVRVLVVSSACHSGGVVDGAKHPAVRGFSRDLTEPHPVVPDGGFQRIRVADDEEAEQFESALVITDVGQFDAMNDGLPRNDPSIAFVAACGAAQTVLDGANATTHSPFVERFLMFARGVKLSLAEFEAAMRAVSPSNAMPSITRHSSGGFDAGFEAAGVFRLA